MFIVPRILDGVSLLPQDDEFNPRHAFIDGICHSKILQIGPHASTFVWQIPGLKITLYIANRSRLKVFVVVEMNCNSLENICSWPVTWYLVRPNPVAQWHYCYFTGKVSRLPMDLQKPQKFSTSSDLQYTQCL